MNYAELKKSYDLVIQKCSALEKEVDELKKSNEDKDLRIEHLTEYAEEYITTRLAVIPEKVYKI
jgi:hypothetical protein